MFRILGSASRHSRFCTGQASQRQAAVAHLSCQPALSFRHADPQPSQFLRHRTSSATHCCAASRSNSILSGLQDAISHSLTRTQRNQLSSSGGKTSRRRHRCRAAQVSPAAAAAGSSRQISVKRIGGTGGPRKASKIACQQILDRVAGDVVNQEL